ncbi:hypothetical protein [Cellulomonas oligotrophica]|uniref:Ribosomal protein S18 acetylase RimI-like enzyme n=1 Tax=Cellulomonas oligotrophica TaxID=931536 RepID=A0A7Y9JWK4_9CELL|nr:hypothetical protein [Cellulomonas oligotrophica]NYD85758.1 ribosomal protein S18 acetylase RimI-like enzyme [Cellulomonas oligotrophica]GIG31235.1 hypothetical protein Col01nite_03940 [Cellulomonas oligotrophica]
MSSASEHASARFALLLDTNAFIALEPTSPSFEAALPEAAELVRLAQEGGHAFFLSAAIELDFDRDPRLERRAANRALSRKYRTLEKIAAAPELLSTLGEAPPPPGRNSNDDVDLVLLATLWVGAIDFLVSDDVKLRRRGVRAGLGDRIFTVVEAAAFLRRLSPKTSDPPPAVEPVKTYSLNAADPIFASLRRDYDGFDDWLRRTCSAPGRPAWVIRSDDGSYGAVMIVKDEKEGDGDVGLPGRVLKLSTFKVADQAMGRSYGELLLKTLFGYLHTGEYDTVYVTAYPKHERLIELLDAFGFSPHGTPGGPNDELVLAKHRRPVDVGVTDPLEAHRRHGPPFIHPNSRFFVVPVLPVWHDALFPDFHIGLDLWVGRRPYGNALRKAYVSGTRSRLVAAGDALLLYRSVDLQAVTVVGVVEDVCVSSDPEVIRRFVGRRTVYTPGDLAQMAAEHGELHAMIFRQDRLLDPPISRRTLEIMGALNGPPQSITQVRSGGRAWLHQQLAESQ